jgi:hypothetical protein
VGKKEGLKSPVSSQQLVQLQTDDISNDQTPPRQKQGAKRIRTSGYSVCTFMKSMIPMIRCRDHMH